MSIRNLRYSAALPAVARQKQRCLRRQILCRQSGGEMIMKRIALTAMLTAVLFVASQSDARAQFGIGIGSFGPGYGGYGPGYGGLGYGGMGYGGLGYGGMGYGSGLSLRVGPSIGYGRAGYGNYNAYRPSYGVGYGGYNSYRPAYVVRRPSYGYARSYNGYRRCR